MALRNATAPARAGTLRGAADGMRTCDIQLGGLQRRGTGPDEVGTRTPETSDFVAAGIPGEPAGSRAHMHPLRAGPDLDAAKPGAHIAHRPRFTLLPNSPASQQPESTATGQLQADVAVAVPRRRLRAWRSALSRVTGMSGRCTPIGRRRSSGAGAPPGRQERSRASAVPFGTTGLRVLATPERWAQRHATALNTHTCPVQMDSGSGRDRAAICALDVFVQCADRLSGASVRIRARHAATSASCAVGTSSRTSIAPA